MCLNAKSVVRVKKPTRRKVKGFKVFRLESTGTPRFEYAIQPLILSHWMKAERDKSDTISRHLGYPVGFHIFRSKKAADDWKKNASFYPSSFIVPVTGRLKFVSAISWRGTHCFVCKELFFSKTDWKKVVGKKCL